MKELVLRDYQMDSVEDLRQGVRDGHKNQILVGATAFGKTAVSIHLMAEALKRGSKVDFICDRIQLVNQTSAALDSYGIDHGVMQANHWRHRPHLPIQVCSAQSLERRGYRKDADLVIADEIHSSRAATTKFLQGTPAKVIGLTATPFTAGLSKTFSRITNAITTNKLIERGYLTPLKVYASVEADMRGAKVIAGEWSDKEVEERGSKIVGDVVAEWISKTSLHFGGPVKTIAFSATVGHGEEVCRQFKEAGYRFEQVSYLTKPEEYAELMAEFAKPDSQIMGIVSVEKLVKGYDQPDVMCGICLRPLRQSFSTHVQMLGRLMRIAPGTRKAEFGFALWLDHSGNFLRFKKDLENLFEFGVKELDDGEKDHVTRKEPTQKERIEIVCSCGFILAAHMKSCPSCGKERKKKSLIETLPGQMVEVGQQRPLLPNGKKMAVWMQNKPEVWAMLSTKVRDVAARKGLGPEDPYVMRMMKAKWHTWYGEWPNFAFPTKHDAMPCQNFNGRWVRDQIAFAKKRAA